MALDIYMARTVWTNADRSLGAPTRGWLCYNFITTPARVLAVLTHAQNEFDGSLNCREKPTLMALAFEWDDGKAASNAKKHGVTFDEASTVFGDPLAVVFDDDEHSVDEHREIIVGHSVKSIAAGFVHRTRPECCKNHQRPQGDEEGKKGL